MPRINLEERLGSFNDNGESQKKTNNNSEALKPKTLKPVKEQKKEAPKKSKRVETHKNLHESKNSKPKVEKQNPLKKLNNIQDETEDLPIDYDKFEEELETEDELEKENIEYKKKKKEGLRKVVQGILILGCIYLVFLIFGACKTQYIYNDEGKVVPQVVSIEDIRKLNDYKDYLAQYRQARTLYEQVIFLDYRIGAGEDDPQLIAPEYETLLEDINDLAIQVSALEPSPEYKQLTELLTVWVKQDLAIYCQKMSSAISKNNANDAEVAIQYKSRMHEDFSAITQNTITAGKQVVGADITDILEWSPEAYLENKIGG